MQRILMILAVLMVMAAMVAATAAPAFADKTQVGGNNHCKGGIFLIGVCV